MSYKALYISTSIVFLFVIYRLMRIFNGMSFTADDGWTLNGGYIFFAMLLVAMPLAVGLGIIILGHYRNKS